MTHALTSAQISTGTVIKSYTEVMLQENDYVKKQTNKKLTMLKNKQPNKKLALTKVRSKHEEESVLGSSS